MLYFWIVISTTLIVALGVLAVSNRNTGSVPATNDDNRAAKTFYKSLLTELDHDLSAGKIRDAEYSIAKLELDRELLKQTIDVGIENKAGYSSSKLLIVVIPAIAAIAFFTYVFAGSPGFQNVPLSDRQAAIQRVDLNDAVDKVQSHLEANPDDVLGWQVIAPIFVRQQDYTDAVVAYRNIVRLQGESSDNLTDLAEAVTLSQNGQVTGEPLALLEAAANLDPSHIRSQFYLAGEATRIKDYQTAIKLWSNLIDRSAGNEEWLGTARSGLNFAQAQSGVEVTSFDSNGPTEADIEASAELSIDDRQQMISQMVEGLSERLATNGGNGREWAQLINARMVMGDTDAAKAALADARTSLAANSAERTRFEELASTHIKTLENMAD